MKCEDCGSENPPEAQFCQECGQKIEKKEKKRGIVTYLVVAIGLIFLILMIGSLLIHL